MNCPLCGEKLEPVERSGVEIEICTGCKGVWLDRGELNKLLALGTEGAGDLDTPRARAEKTSCNSVYSPVPDEIPNKFKHLDRSRFRDMAKGAGRPGGVSPKPVRPGGSNAKPGRGKGRGGNQQRASAILDVLESISGSAD